ncbi:MFS general substrate transporter [Hypoxylon trugodes]|uniref:MFS general substrate transporter n=1 Tax=Hypoxylon trugodes TaxID=326681 RepID=UPI002195117A|nr:MFS general substrate transporter [Hypoxylon trugodes]KAI1386683.1 MFS general substrate transporter [Hypoxylon trugodes]
MVQDLNGGDDTDASFYAGLLVSAYAVAEALTAIGWGALSDRYGRKPVVLFGLGGVAISSLIFGLATEYWVALLARFIGGALNGNVAVMQTMVAEMVKIPEHEPVAYASQPFVWTLGGIIGSAMGGFLAQPAIFYPSIFPADGIFGRYPYLLPNLVSVVAIILAIIQGILFLEETNPRGGKATDDSLFEDDDTIDERTPLHGSKNRRSSIRSHSIAASDRPVFIEESLPVPVEQNFDLRRSSFGTARSIRLPPAPPKQEEKFTGRTFNFTIIMITISLVLVSYHQMAFNTLLPTHLLDKPAAGPGEIDLIGGLGYTVHDVGVYLSVNGILGLFIQGIIFPIFVDKVGVWKSFIINVVFYPLAYMIMPFLSVIPEALVSPGIYLSMILQSFFGIIVIPCALILLKDATPSPLVLGKVNGLAMSACCLARTISPPLVGIIYSAGGSAAAWFSCGGVAIIGIVQLLSVPRKHSPSIVGDNDIKAGKSKSGAQNEVFQESIAVME